MTQKRVTLDKKTVNVKDIHLEVTCPECGRQYGVTCKGANFTKNVSCLHGTFYIQITPMVGAVDINVSWRGATTKDVEFTAEIES